MPRLLIAAATSSAGNLPVFERAWRAATAMFSASTSKKPPQRLAGVAAAEAVRTERDEVLAHPGADHVGHGLDEIGRGDDRALDALEHVSTT